MSVKKTGSPLSSGSEPLAPLNPKELQKAVKSGGFDAQLAALEQSAETEGAGGAESPTLQSLRNIASKSDFSNQSEALAAVRESARYMINSRIQEKFRADENVSEMVEDLSQFVAADPFMQRKLLKILERLKG